VKQHSQLAVAVALETVMITAVVALVAASASAVVALAAAPVVNSLQNIDC